jgi:hypothetical protein
MCGIDFVTPFQGSDLFEDACSQGVALGYPVSRLQRGMFFAIAFSDLTAFTLQRGRVGRLVRRKSSRC